MSSLHVSPEGNAGTCAELRRSREWVFEGMIKNNKTIKQ